MLVCFGQAGLDLEPAITDFGVHNGKMGDKKGFSIVSDTSQLES